MKNNLWGIFDNFTTFILIHRSFGTKNVVINATWLLIISKMHYSSIKFSVSEDSISWLLLNRSCFKK